MRRAGGLFEDLWSFENLELAARRAQAGKRYRPEVLRFNLRREDELHRLSEQLRAGLWRPGEHRHFVIHEPKLRWISAAPYRDRVVHHALCNLIEPEIDRRLIFDCWANRRGKGSHRAVLRYQQFAGRFAFALKIDIRQYFPSIDHAILKAALRRVFKDRRLIDLMDLVIDTGCVPEPFFAYFAGDDLFTPFDRAKGLPIGNLTSQLWANLYLDRFDHWVKEVLGVGGYLRFVDDIVLLADSKAALRAWLGEIEAKLAEEFRLVPHPRKSVLRPTREPLPFLGYVVSRDRIRVRGETVRRFRRRVLRRLGSRAPAEVEDLRRSVAAWRGHVQLAGTWRQLRGGK